MFVRLSKFQSISWSILKIELQRLVIFTINYVLLCNYVSGCFYNTYNHDKHLPIFQIGSLAEFHKSPLHTMLAKYVSAINNNNEEYAYQIIKGLRLTL